MAYEAKLQKMRAIHNSPHSLRFRVIVVAYEAKLQKMRAIHNYRHLEIFCDKLWFM